jgi:lipoprotein NlpI
MGKSEETLTDATVDELYNQLVALHDALGGALEDKQDFKAQALSTTSNFGQVLSRMGVMATKRNEFIAALPTADITFLSNFLNDLATVPAEPDPTNPPEEPPEEPLALEDGET